MIVHAIMPLLCFLVLVARVEVSLHFSRWDRCFHQSKDVYNSPFKLMLWFQKSAHVQISFFFFFLLHCTYMHLSRLWLYTADRNLNENIYNEYYTDSVSKTWIIPHSFLMRGGMTYQSVSWTRDQAVWFRALAGALCCVFRQNTLLS